MSVINNNEISNTNKQVKNMRYVLPAVVRKDKEPVSLEKALTIALILHPLVFFLLWGFLLIAELLGLNLLLFNQPDMRPKDIEFVLVEKEGTPIDKNTRNRADINSRAGGINDPNRPVSLPQTSAPNTPAKKPTLPAPAPAQKTTPQKAQPAQTAQPKQTKTEPAPKAPAPRPTPAPSAPKPTAKPNSSFNIPIPKSNIPQIAQPSSTAPVTAAPSIGGSSSGKAGGSSSASPSFSPTTAKGGTGTGGTGTGAGGGGRFSNGTGSGTGNVGNPGPGNPKGAPGIDALKEPDFGPYMKELQRRIKMNWDPPKGNESKRVVLLFSIARDGRLLNIKVSKSSGLPAADQAAISAVKLTAPFRPLPVEYKRDSVDIQFTFDYNVFGGGISGY